MGTCLSCILGDSEEATASPTNFNNTASTNYSNNTNKYLFSSTSSPANPKAKLKSDKIDALIEKQASEHNNIVKILLLGK